MYSDVFSANYFGFLKTNWYDDLYFIPFFLFQEEVYERTSRILMQNVMNGYNATVFAYGATGKTSKYISSTSL